MVAKIIVMSAALYFIGFINNKLFPGKRNKQKPMEDKLKEQFKEQLKEQLKEQFKDYNEW